jgi:hypothetical protein
MTTQFEAGTLFEAPFAHEAGHGPSPELAPEYGTPEFAGETGPGSHESQGEWSGEGESGYESTFETGYESAYETGGYEIGGYETGGYETGYETGGYETGGYETGYETGGYETGSYEQDRFLGNLLSGAMSALGLGEEELEGEAGWEWSGEAGQESDQFLGQAFKALRRVVGRVVPQARALLPGALGSLASLLPGGGLLKGPLGAALRGLLREGEQEVSAAEAGLLGSGESVGESRDERGQEAALTEIMANEAVLAESEDEAASILATTLPITITIMGGRRALRPVVPAYTQAHRRLVTALRRDPQSRHLLRAVPSIDRRAVWLLRRWQRAGRPVTGPVAVNALAAAARDVLGGDPRRLRRFLLRNGVIRLRTAPLHVRRLQVYRPTYRRAAVRPYGAPRRAY